MNINFDFNGRKVLVTGAANGIGRGIASALVKSKGKVYAVDRDSNALDALTRKFPSIVPIVTDITDWEQTKKALEQVECLDGLVNCAGIAFRSTPIDATESDIRRMLDVNLLAAINMCQIVSKKMIDGNKPGSIVNISSIAGISAAPFTFAYSIAKAGLDMVTKQFALVLGPHNIRVNSVNPTMVKTDLLKNYIVDAPSAELNVLERTPLPRTPEVEEVVGPILYLLSDCAAMVTGSLHPIDAGILCNITTKK